MLRLESAEATAEGGVEALDEVEEDDEEGGDDQVDRRQRCSVHRTRTA